MKKKASSTKRMGIATDLPGNSRKRRRAAAPLDRCMCTILGLTVVSLALLFATSGGVGTSDASARSMPDGVPSNPCWVTKVGADGFGHQLHGMISVVALHGMEHPLHGRYRFSFDATPRPFEFEHIEPRSQFWNESEAFFRGGLLRFAENVCPACFASNVSHVNVYEWKRVPDDCPKKKAVFGLDNMWSFPRTILGTCKGSLRTEGWKKRFRARLSVAGKPFVHGLPQVHLEADTTAVHVRLGDATARTSQSLVDRTLALIHKYARQGPVVIDSDDAEQAAQMLMCQGVWRDSSRWCFHGEMPSNIRIFGKEESILNALSRFVHASRFIGARSSLSAAAAMMRDKEMETFMPKERLHRKCQLYPTHLSAF